MATQERELPDIRSDKTKLAVVPIDEETDSIEYRRKASTEERLQHAELLRRIAYGHGHPRLTNDLDIAIANDRHNIERRPKINTLDMTRALRCFNFRSSVPPVCVESIVT